MTRILSDSLYQQVVEALSTGKESAETWLADRKQALAGWPEKYAAEERDVAQINAALTSLQSLPVAGREPTDEPMLSWFNEAKRLADAMVTARVAERGTEYTQTRLTLHLHLSAPPGEPKETHPDTKRLDWLEETNRRFRMGWRVGMAPAGNVSLQAVIQIGPGPLTTIREAIDAAKESSNG
jgi:hypothetical protein